MKDANCTFDEWDPFRGEIPANATQEFLVAVKRTRLMLNQRTLPELQVAISTIRRLHAGWVESKKGEAMAELRKRALAGEAEALSFYQWERDGYNVISIYGYRHGEAWVESADMRRLMGAFKRKELKEIFLQYLRVDEFVALRERITLLRVDDPGFPGARPFEYFAALALHKAAMAVEAMAGVVSLQDQMQDFSLPGDLIKNRSELLRYFNFLKKTRGLTTLFLEIVEYAQCLLEDESQRKTIEPPIDPQVQREMMSAIGRRGAAVVHRKRREVRRYVEDLFREGWMNNRWRNPHQAVSDLLPLAQAKAAELQVSHCLDGEYNRAFKTVYDSWILPLSRKLRLVGIPRLAAISSTHSRHVE